MAGKSKKDYVTLHQATLKQIIPDANAVLRLLLETGVIERDFYRIGDKSYGYRFVAEAFHGAIWRKTALNDPRITARLAKRRNAQQPVHRWLRQQLYHLGLRQIDEEYLRYVADLSTIENGGSIFAKLDCYAAVLRYIQDGYHDPVVDDYGRFHSALTTLKRELRRFLIVNDQTLSEIDIRNSQLLFLGLEMQRKGIDSGDFLAKCQDDVYQYVAGHAKTTRAKVKKTITQWALFSANDDRAQRTAIMQTFVRLFPETARFVYEFKQQKDGGSRLAKQLQRAESNFVIRTVCDRVRRERSDCFLATIHDSFLFLPDDAEYVRGVIEQEFARLGVAPRLEITKL